jgi:hypothetical protein
MDGTILYFKQLFVFETIDNAEQPFWRSRHDQRTSTILWRQAASKRGCHGIVRFGVKSKDASKKKPETDKRAGRGRKSVDSALTRPAKKFRKRNAVAVRRQVNRPDVVQRDVGEKRMHAKR